MPTAIIWAVGYLAEYGVISAATAFAIGSFVATYGTAIMLIGGLAYSAEKAKQAKADAKNQFNASQVDRFTNISSATAPRDLVLGRVRKAGTVFYKASTGSYQKDMYLAIALAGHEIDAVEQIYINDVVVTLDGSGNVTTAPYLVSSKASDVLNSGAGFTVTLNSAFIPSSIVATITTVNGRGNELVQPVTPISQVGNVLTFSQTNVSVSYQYSANTSNIQITPHLGAAGQTADASLRAAFPSDWSANNVVQGIAYLVVRLTYSESSFPSGAPNITALVRGANVYDPRTTLTAWSENPALLMRHVYQHAKFGKAIVTATEDARFIAAANACDTATIYTVGGVAQASRALFTAGTVAPFGTAAKSLFDDLAQAMGGSWAFYQGELYVKPGVYSASVLSLGDADLATVTRDGSSETQNPIKISTHRERAKKFNTVNVTIWDSSQGYKQAVLTPLQPSAYLARDGAELVQNDTFSAISYAPQALHVAGIMLRDARDPLSIEVAFKMRAYPVELFDTIDLTIARYGWSAKTFMVVGRQWSGNGVLLFSLKETTASITQMDAGFSAQGFAVNTKLPAPWNVGAIGTLTITSGTTELLRQGDGTVNSRMKASWSLVQDLAVQQAGKVEIQYRRADSSGSWTSVLASGNDTFVYISDVQDGITYVVRARATTNLAIGTWETQISHTVVGKTALPADCSALTYSIEVTGVRLAWLGVSDADLQGYELRIGGANWAGASFLAFTKDISYLLKAQASGSYALWVKALDTTGNYSTNAASLTAVVGGPSAPGLSYSITGISEYLSWTISSSGFQIDRYEIRFGSTWAGGTFIDTTKATGYIRKVDYSGARTYWVAAIDSVGNYGAAASIGVNISAPGAVTGVRTDVVDNNVLIYWLAPSTGTLPVSSYEVRKGSTWAGGTVVGSNGNSTFTAVFEQQSGTYTYWIAAIDSVGNYGTPASTAAYVNQPPDYILRANINSTFNGTLVNTLLSNGTLLLPVNTTETWTQHFVNNGYATPQAQITAGNPIYINPSLTSASYTEVIDYGSSLPATNVVVTLNSTVLSGAVSASCQINYSNTSATGPWTSGTAGATAVLATNFRWVQVIYTFTAAAGVNLLRVDGLNIKLSVKQRTDSGTGAVAVAGTGAGVTFGYSFISADTPIVQPNGATPLIPVVVYVGGINPTGFTVYLYTLAGALTTGSFSWSVRGY